MRRWWPRSIVAGAVLLCASIAIASANSDVSPIETAIEATNVTIAARALADQIVIIAVGGLLLGAGVGVVAAAGLVYWYKNRQIQGRLQ